MKIIISILSVVVVFLAAWNCSLSIKHQRMKRYLISHIEYDDKEQGRAGENAKITATIKSMADSTEKVWAELLEIKSKDLIYLSESIVIIRKDMASLMERQDKITQGQYDYFGGKILELHETIIETQKQIARLHGAGS
jgi:hypothetical protein